MNLSDELWASFKRIKKLELLMSLMEAAGYLGILYMLINGLLAGEITVGAFAAVFGSIGWMFGMLGAIVYRRIGYIMSGMGEAHNYIRFMELPERVGIESVPDFDKGIIAKNVSFTYPNAIYKSIDDVSFTIKAGETIAIVGKNGAGKTTLARLIMGLYQPEDGTIVVNGMNTKIVDNSVFKNTSGVFQRFQRYQMTLKENVQISDNDKNVPIDDVLSLANVNKNAASFPEGVDTMLSREFDGVELSGGQWQRVAIARGLYRSHNIIALDEPTAAIDPLEESRVYNQFIEISRGKTAIIITHRLGSAKIADRVMVMDNGKIVDMGTHNELVQRCEVYADMYNSQSEWYTESPVLD